MPPPPPQRQSPPLQGGRRGENGEKNEPGEVGQQLEGMEEEERSRGGQRALFIHGLRAPLDLFLAVVSGGPRHHLGLLAMSLLGTITYCLGYPAPCQFQHHLLPLMGSSLGDPP